MAAYEAPSWSADPPNEDDDELFKLEMVKNGEIVSVTNLRGKSYFVLGRAKGAVDVALDNPTVSRFHVVLQFDGRDGEWKLYDNGSTHGTFLNKQRLEAQTYVRLSVGSTFKLGCSTRFFVLSGPMERMPPEYDSENLRELRSKKCCVEKKNITVPPPSRKIEDTYQDDDDDDDDDEVLDETVHKRKRDQKKRDEDIVWNRKKLEVDLKRLVDLDRSTRRDMEQLMLKEQLGKDDHYSGTDSLATFMQGSQMELYRKEIKRLGKLREEYEESRKHRIRLLRAICTEMTDMSDEQIVADVIARESRGRSANIAPKKIDMSRAVPAQSRYAVHRLESSKQENTKKRKKAMMPPPPPPVPSFSANEKKSMSMPPPVPSFSSNEKKSIPLPSVPSFPVSDEKKSITSSQSSQSETTQHEEEPPQKRRRRRRRRRKKNHLTKQQRVHDDKNEEEPPAWTPPKNQTGDGKTSLNAKLGY